MKKQSVRVLCLLLSIAMLFSLLPVSAFAADVQEGGGISTQADGDLVIPGYTQVTALRQIKADKKYLIVAQAPDKTFYALYLNADGANNSPGTTAYPNCTATLTVSGNTVSAVSTANTSTSIAMNDLHVTITESSGGSYTIKNSTHALRLNGTMYIAAGSAPALPLSFVDGGRFSVKGNGRYLTFNVNGATSTETHFPTHPTGFCGWNDPQPQYIPIYLFVQGDLPVEPGMNLSNMLSGDKIGGGATENANPDGQNSWVFTGGRAAQGSFADVKGARTYAGHFEEYVRYTNAKQLQPSGESTTPYFQRHVINAAYEGQKLADIVSSFDTRILPLKPRAISYLVDEGGSSEPDFAANLNSLITKALALQNNTGMIVIETLTQADKTAVDNVVNGLASAQQANVLSVQFTLTATQKTNGYPNASGHFAMAQQLADTVTGATVSTNANWPYGAIGGSVMDTGFPNKTSLDHTHGYVNPTTLTAGQAAIKAKVDNKSAAMTWLFMGDSITHGAAWTGGYDTLAQLFEKFVKDDLGRKQDVVINAGSSGATTASTINDLNRRLVKYSPDVVVVMLGTNDAGGSVAEATYKANLRTILDKIIAKGATPVLRTPPPTSRSNYDIATYAQYVRDVVDEAKYAGNVILVDQYALWTANDWSGVFTRDTLHPDEAGHLWFAHQLIKELALWNDSYGICRLEYVEMKEAEAISIPGYTLITDISQLDEAKSYLIVSQDSDGELYALYPSKDGETLGAGALPSPNGADDGARTAKLTVTGKGADATVTAAWLKDNSALKMDNLLFNIKKNTSNNKYVFTAFTGYHLNMTTQMFTEGTAELTVTSRGTAAPYAFRIQNGRRSLDFSKHGDPNAFYNSGQNINAYGTDFWCPNDNIKMCTYLFASNTVGAQTAKEGLQKLIDEIKAANLSETAYTRASWSALQSALTAAETVVANNTLGADAQEVTAAWDALRVAYEGLNEKPVAPTVPGTATKIEDWHTMVPASGTSKDEPFASGTGGSNKFRIPAIITLQHQSDASKNGRLLAAIDARWNHTGDACGLDTIVSYSDDTGANWNYNFANYFGDSTNAYAQYGTAFIDPVLLEGQDGTIYLMVDIWPGGVALNTAPNGPANSTGCETIDGTKRLVLYTAAPNASSTTYDYYVGDFADGYAPVCEPINGADDVFSGYYIDEYYYLYYNAATTFAEITTKGANADKIYCQRLNNSEWVQQNVFFYNATLHVRDASYLWIVTSKDGGETWGNPKMINAVRTDNERFYGVGPGAGLCMEDGTLLLPVYIWPTEKSAFIYSKDNGATWQPSPQYAANGSSESCLVQIDDTTVRHFYRDSWNRSSVPVRYTDHTWNGTTWVTGDPILHDTANRYGACQVSAIKYSQQIDGKDLILYSTPTNSGGRSKGVIHAFLVNEDKTMTLYNTYSVNGDLAYAYSSLTETADGDIALLYESTSDQVVFKIIPFTDIVPTITLTVTGYEGDYDGEAHTVSARVWQGNQLLQNVPLYFSEDGETWGEAYRNTYVYTDVGEHTVYVKAVSDDIVKVASATVKINQATPTISITADKDAYQAGETATFTISGVPSKVTDVDTGASEIDGAIILQCSNMDPDHDRNITLTRDETTGNYTGTHVVREGGQTFTATYTDSNGNYKGATATCSITVAPSAFGLNAKDVTCPYDGQPHSITVTAAEDVTLTYCDTEDGTYTGTKPEYTNAGTYTIYFKATKGGEIVSGSANLTINRATPTITFQCNHETEHGSGDEHSIETTALPLVLTIKGVPAQDQGHFTLTTFGDAVRNLAYSEDTGNWTASPNLPPITRTYHFIAVFDPTCKQNGDEISNPNYNRATAEFTVTVSRPPDEVINFNFNFADGVAIDPDISTRGTLTVPYDGLNHSPLEALTYDAGLELTYHVPTEDAEDNDDAWINEAPTFRQPGTYTVSCMASPTNSPVAKVLTVVLEIEVQEIPTSLTITPDHDELEGGGTVTLTVAGMPEAGTLTVTCDKTGISVTETARGTYTVTLPDADAAYEFMASYSGAGSYQSADATCTVVVIGTSQPDDPGPVPVVPVVPSVSDGDTKTEVKENEDGSTTTTVTDNKTGTVTETTEKEDGTVEVVETKADGTVTETTTDPEGGKVEKVTSPEKDVAITVTDKDGEVLAKVELPAEIPAPETRFADVPEGHWADEAIHNMAALEVVDGVGGDRYNMNGNMTRGALATVLRRMSNGQEGLEANFTDVDSDEWYADGIAWAARVGVVTGRSADTFAPEATITREELAVMLCRYARLLGIDTTADSATLDSFNDGSSTHSWAADSLAWCVENGILKGMGNDTLAPTATATRAQVAVMLQRFIDLMK